MQSVDRHAAALAIDAFLRALGHDPERDTQLIGTGRRVAAAYADELLVGYTVDVDEMLSQSVVAGRSELVVVRDVPVWAVCPHHLLPSGGVATVAFAPDAHLVGIGAVARLVDAFARRLVLQEQIGERVVAALQKHLLPRWAACRIDLSHACMTARGERSHGATVETLALSGSGLDLALIHAIVGAGR